MKTRVTPPNFIYNTAAQSANEHSSECLAYATSLTHSPFDLTKVPDHDADIVNQMAEGGDLSTKNHSTYTAF